MKKILSVFLAIVFLVPIISLGVFAEVTKSYTINSPYADVIWSGDKAWGAYKGNLHTHSTVSDAEVDYKDMIMEYYRQGYDFLAMTDHGVTGKNWNEKPTQLPLYLYQYIIGNSTHYLTDDEYKAVTTGTYPVDDVARGKGMVCVPGGNELNALTITKDHVNGIFLPEHVGDNHLGYENNHECAVKLVDEAGNGAVSFINHPGDWLNSNRDRNICNDSETIDYFSNIILSYDSCLGMEVFNERNSVTRYDRVLWDSLLTRCLQYGKTVIAFSNGDTHYIRDVDSSFSVFMMEENNLENIRNTMINGAFFCVTRILGSDPILGPDEDMDMRNTDVPYPMFTQVSVDGHKITVKGNEYNNIQWVADGKVIAEQDITQTSADSTYVLDLDKIEGAEDFSYVRCQLIGKGGITLTQALVIDDGTEPLVYEKDASFKTTVGNFFKNILNARIFVLIKLVVDAIKDKLS